MLNACRRLPIAKKKPSVVKVVLIVLKAFSAQEKQAALLPLRFLLIKFVNALKVWLVKVPALAGLAMLVTTITALKPSKLVRLVVNVARDTLVAPPLCPLVHPEFLALR